ncbi:hypothetical protein A2U01_0079936, partial [Trifolium medium]|nr:hypothetical protein [Trifolium medium]
CLVHANQGKYDLNSSANVNVDIGAPTEARRNSVLKSLKETSPESDAAPNATTSVEQENLNNIVIPKSPETVIISEKEKSL